MLSKKGRRGKTQDEEKRGPLRGEGEGEQEEK